jgi:light-regulated signal transduction histidine kinase (bacteriophytochrome)
VANIELKFQNDEKAKRSNELLIANEELLFQNGEKEMRAAELVIANHELAFQNEEKGKRAAELLVANAELIYQNHEKEQRAAELIIANEELAFQNEEKGKRAEELVLINNELESFCYSVSHDLQSPVRKMGAYATMLEKKYTLKLDSEGEVIIGSIIRNSKKMGTLIADLLSFSQLGRKQIAVSEINMASLVKSITEEWTSEDQDGRLIFKLGEILPVRGDESLIKQVWINLISNAIKYSKYKSKTIIEIGCHDTGKDIVYYLKDNGIGFDMQYHDKIFGVFQRLHTQDEFEGTGIGLAVVQKIVERHYGRIWAESFPGDGTTFYFSLPK